MECPTCNDKTHVEIDLHAEGFSQDAFECGECGCVWTFAEKNLKIIKERQLEKQKLYAEFVCPTCKQMVSHETDLDAFQFHEEFYECTGCGTVCSSAHNQIEVVTDSQPGSFLSSTTDLVEADDYVFV